MVAPRFIAATFAATLVCLTTQEAGRAAPRPRFEPAPCPFSADDTILEHVRCGYLTVPENRAKPESRRLKLSVAILKSSSPKPQPDPVVILAGGPGEHFVSRAPTVIANRWTDILRADRDIILYDQRGVGFSEPAFCPELADEQGGTFDGPAQRRAHQRELAARCGESMRRAGYDLSQYNSVVSAHDLQDLRRALGYRSWHLHGRSYGSRLALVAMRVAPEGIRSVVIDGPLPPHRVKWFNIAGDFTDVLKRLSAECASQPPCNAAFPDVEQTFWRTVEALQREPLTLQRTLADGTARSVRMTAARFAAQTYNALQQLQPAVPMFVHAVHTRDGARVDAVVFALGRAAAGRAGAVSRRLGQTVNCFEEAPLATPELQRSTRAAYSPVLTDEGIFDGPEGATPFIPIARLPNSWRR